VLIIIHSVAELLSLEYPNVPMNEPICLKWIYESRMAAELRQMGEWDDRYMVERRIAVNETERLIFAHVFAQAFVSEVEENPDDLAIEAVQTLRECFPDGVEERVNAPRHPCLRLLRNLGDRNWPRYMVKRFIDDGSTFGRIWQQALDEELVEFNEDYGHDVAVLTDKGFDLLEAYYDKRL